MTKVGVLFPLQMKTEMRQLISDYIPHYLWLRVTIYSLKMRMLLLFASELQGKLSLALAQSCLQPTAPPVQHSHPELCQRCPPVHSLIPLYWPLVNTLLFRVVWAFMTQCGRSELLWISPYTRYLKRPWCAASFHACPSRHSASSSRCPTGN